MLLDCDKDMLISYLHNTTKLTKKIEEAYQVKIKFNLVVTQAIR